MDKCILCGEHLYQDITFSNLFRWRYKIHDECVKKLDENRSYAIPYKDKTILFLTLFSDDFPKHNENMLFEKYGELLFSKLNEYENWSIVLYIDDMISYEDFVLVTELSENDLLILKICDGNFLSENVKR